jgi:hypothetical protein
VLQGEDDGSAVIEVNAWLEERDGEKPLGVYGKFCAHDVSV